MDLKVSGIILTIFVRIFVTYLNRELMVHYTIVEKHGIVLKDI